jgi:hypothetical protein
MEAQKELALHDALSRVPDPSDWGLAPKVLQMVLSQFGHPQIDLFASDSWHVTERFISPRFMPGCEAVDALSIDWRTVLGPDEVAWMFPPTRSLIAVIHNLKRFSTNAILVVLKQQPQLVD